MWKNRRILTNTVKADDLVFNELYHQYWDLLFRLAYKKTGSPDDAYDLVHDLFLDIWRDFEKLPAADSIRSYLVSCLFHKVFNYFRSKGLQEKHFKNLAQFLSQQAGADVQLQEEEQRQLDEIDQVISTEITRMPVKMKDILIRNFYRKQSIDQIAGDLSLSRQTVKNQLHLASKRLRHAVKQICAQLFTTFLFLLFF